MAFNTLMPRSVSRYVVNLVVVSVNLVLLVAGLGEFCLLIIRN